MSMLSPEKPLYLIGASVRACATSLCRSPIGDSIQLKTCDLFADADLRLAADASICSAADYPDGLGEWLLQNTPGYVIFTGGIENYPDLIGRVAARHELLGCAAATLRKCRDPFQFAAAFSQEGIATAKIQSQFPTSGRWLEKPIASCAGFNIRHIATVEEQGRAADAKPTDKVDLANRYFQERIEGRSVTGLFVTDGRSTSWLGATCGLTTSELPVYRELKLPPFLYAGSFGPVTPSDHESAEWRRLGEIATDSFELRGAFGIDAIINSEGEIVPLEINPRFTASMELIDIAFDTSVAQLHIDCFTGQRRVNVNKLPQSGTMAKLIVYAISPTHIDEALHGRLMDESAFLEAGIRVADVPVASTEIKPGSPLCTLLVPNRFMPDNSAEFVDAANQHVENALSIFSQQ